MVRGMFWNKQGGLTPQDLMEATGHHDLESPQLPDWVARWAESLDLLTQSSKAEAANKQA